MFTIYQTYIYMYAYYYLWCKFSWQFDNTPWNTVKSFNFVGTKLRGLKTVNMLVDTWTCGFKIILNITKV